MAKKKDEMTTTAYYNGCESKGEKPPHVLFWSWTVRRKTGWVALAVLTAVLGSCSRKLPYEGKSAAELEDMLAAEDAKTRARGAYGLGQDPAKAREAIPALIEALGNRDAEVREYAARALGTAGPDARAAVPALTKALEDASWTVQRQAAMALGKIGPEARPALPALEKLTEHANVKVREEAQKAVRLIEAGQP